MLCNVCDRATGEPVFQSSGDLSVTSLAGLRPGQTRVFYCDACGHLQTEPLPDIDEYYDHDYNILIDSADEDQMYAVKDGRPVFRTEHQFDVLLEKLAFRDGHRVLDYGCGKGAVLQRLVQARPQIIPHAFEVSDVYTRFWKDFLEPDRWACYRINEAWAGSFDVVLSFFALEHTAQPRAFVSEVAAMLKPGGIFYFLVPNPHDANISDMLVVDHVNHFSPVSLHRLLNDHGLVIDEIDDVSHDLAYVVMARKEESPTPGAGDLDVESLTRYVQHMCRFWSDAPDRVRDFERGGPGPSAIYGAGICGCLICSWLDDRSQLECFIDQNPYKQGKTLAGKPIVPLDAFDSRSANVFVGLNPERSRQTVAGIDAWHDRGYRYFYL